MSENHHSIIKSLFSKKMLVVGMMGFFSGLPLLLVGSTLKAWLTESNVDLTVIGFFSIVQIPYTFKFLWAPLMDHFRIFKFGRRRSWMILTQIFLAATLLGLSLTDMKNAIQIVGVFAVLIAFFSASQDVVIDAYRREILSEEEQGLGSSVAVNFYRLAMLASGGLALYLADHISWSQVYQLMAVIMLLGSVFTWFCPEPKVEILSQNLLQAYVKPLFEFFSRKNAWLILAFIVFYKVGESMASDMTTPFLLKTGFTKTEIAGVVKLFGFWATILGAFTGGALLVRMSAGRALLLFGILQAIGLLGFAVIAAYGARVDILAVVISGENFTSGMATSAIVAFMANQCDVRFSATQYALLSSLSSLPRVLAGTLTGFLAQTLGWENYFLMCAAVTIPGLILIFWLRTVHADYHIFRQPKTLSASK